MCFVNFELACHYNSFVCGKFHLLFSIVIFVIVIFVGTRNSYKFQLPIVSSQKELKERHHQKQLKWGLGKIIESGLMMNQML